MYSEEKNSKQCQQICSTEGIRAKVENTVTFQEYVFSASWGVGKSQEKFHKRGITKESIQSFLGRSNSISKSPDIKTQHDKFRELQKVHYNWV